MPPQSGLALLFLGAAFRQRLQLLVRLRHLPALLLCATESILDLFIAPGSGLFQLADLLRQSLAIARRVIPAGGQILDSAGGGFAFLLEPEHRQLDIRQRRRQRFPLLRQLLATAAQGGHFLLHRLFVIGEGGNALVRLPHRRAVFLRTGGQGRDVALRRLFRGGGGLCLLGQAAAIAFKANLILLRGGQLALNTAALRLGGGNLLLQRLVLFHRLRRLLTQSGFFLFQGGDLVAAR